MINVVIGDIHARIEALRLLLADIGIISITSEDPMTDTRNEGFRLHQLGDALSLGYGEIEANFYRYFWHIVNDDDVICIGNHELPVMWPNWTMDFSGWESRDVEAEQMVKERWHQERLVAASSVGDWLLTHAGLIPRYQHEYRDAGASMREVAEDLHTKLLCSIHDNARGRHGGEIEGQDDHMGGIFWVRPDGHMNMDREIHFKQMFGHTPRGPEEIRPNVWLLDTSPKPEIHAKMKAGLRPNRSDFGGVAAMVFETEQSDPKLVVKYD